MVIEAVQYDGNTENLPYAFGAAITRSIAGGSCFIETLEGVHECRVGDFIILGVKGEAYPCKPDIFALTYEPVEA